MGTTSEAYALLKEQVGTVGGEKYWHHVMGTHYESPGGTPFCACGVTWILDMTNTPNPMPSRSRAFDWTDDLGGRGIDKWSGQFMDITSFDWPEKGIRNGKGDHVGFLISYLSESTIETIEFNTGGGRVLRCVRSLDDVICFLRPAWSDTAGEWRRGMSEGNRDKWWYELPDGTWPASAWRKIDGKWYYFDADGWLVGGWLHWKGSWYWLHNEHDGHFGEMAANCCLKINGQWYAFADGDGDDGRMIADRVKCDENGAMIL